LRILELADSKHYPPTQEFATGIDQNKSLETVTNFVLENGLAGAMTWEFKGDDNGSATDKIYSLLNPLGKSRTPSRPTFTKCFNPDTSLGWIKNTQLSVLKFFYYLASYFSSDYNNLSFLNKKREIINQHHVSLRDEYNKKKSEHEPIKKVSAITQPGKVYTSLTPTAPYAD